MKKKTKNIFIFLIVLSLILLVYLLLSYESSEQQVSEGTVDASAMAAEYTEQLQSLVSEYRESASSNELSVGKIENIKNNILDLVVPAQHRDLHVQIVLALIKMEEFIKSSDQAYKIESNNLINEALANNSWLEIK